MDISRISLSSLAGRLLRLPLWLIPKSAVVPICSGPLRGYRWIVGSGTHGYWLGTYECDKQRSIARCLRTGKVFYDLGSNVGFYSLLAAAAGCRVFAFEPSPRNLAFLRRHIVLNGIQNVEIIETAVSDFVGTAPFGDGLTPNDGSLLKAGGLEVRVVALDQMHLPSPDIIKIDIEGSEYHALAGAKVTIHSSRPTIFLATHSLEVHRQCCGLLRSWNYSLDSNFSFEINEGNVVATAL
jgi:FkbM family methyltransferase